MKKYLWAALALFVSTPAFGAEITIDVEGVKALKGTVRCGLYRRGQDFPTGDTRVGHAVKAEANTVRCTLKDVAPGEYAIAVMQDLNGNEKMDTSWVGAPEEPWGVSKNAPAHTFGPPKFDEAKFTVADRPVSMTIRLNQP